MGNFISRAWDKLTGKAQADKAAEVQREALAQQQSEANKATAQKNAVGNKYDELLNILMGIVKGESPKAGTPTAQSYDTLNSVMDILTGRTTTNEQGKANALYNSYINYLTGQSKTGEQQIADGLLNTYLSELTSPNKSKEQKTADEWSAKYLNSLANSADTAFNAGVTELARGMQSKNDSIRKAMNSRGISSSGINVSALGGTSADTARGVSQLQGQRIDRQKANYATGADYTQKLAQTAEDRRLNKLGTATGLADAKNLQAIQNFGTAAGIADTQAQNRQNNLLNALKVSNSYDQQNMQNIMNILTGKTALVNNQAVGNYINGLNSIADNYQAQANAQSNMTGQLLGKIGNAITGANTGGIIGVLGKTLGTLFG